MDIRPFFHVQRAYRIWDECEKRRGIAVERRGIEIFDVNDATRPGRIDAQPRARGTLRLSCKKNGAKTELSRLYQKGSLKALFPRSHADHMDVVFLNTAGGITGGDAYDYELDVSKAARLRATTQAAERVYSAQDQDPGTVKVSVHIDDGATLHWLPQETIIFDQARLARRLTVEMSGAAEFLCVEPMIFGRLAMGETVKSARISDQWRIRRDGKLIFADAFRIGGDVQDLLSRKAVASGNMAATSILMVSERAEAKVAPLRREMGKFGGASLIRDGVLFARLLAPDSFTLRRVLIPAIQVLSDTQIPKTWRL